MIDKKRVMFEESYIIEEFNSATFYFIIDKHTLNEFFPNKYPEAEHGEIRLECPSDKQEPAYCTVMVSPTKCGTDYDWNNVELSYEDIKKLFEVVTDSVEAQATDE